MATVPVIAGAYKKPDGRASSKGQATEPDTYPVCGESNQKSADLDGAAHGQDPSGEIEAGQSRRGRLREADGGSQGYFDISVQYS